MRTNRAIARATPPMMYRTLRTGPAAEAFFLRGFTGPSSSSSSSSSRPRRRRVSSSSSSSGRRRPAAGAWRDLATVGPSAWVRYHLILIAARGVAVRRDRGIDSARGRFPDLAQLFGQPGPVVLGEHSLTAPHSDQV